MVKRNIRKTYSEKRLALDTIQVRELSSKMVDHFRSIALQGAQYLLSYYPIPERKEFDVTVCEQLLKLENENMIIAWPKLLPDKATMDAVVKDDETVMAANSFNILEPINGNIIDPQLIDVVFVPLLAFDLKGYRVGYGKGFYDRYLARCAQDVVKIGFSFFEAIDAIEDVDEYDVPLNFCITPLRVYEF